MTCREFENLLHPYVDDEFDAAERSAADSHLASCAACALRVMHERRFREVLREAVSAHPEQAHASDALRLSVRTALRTAQHRRSARRTLYACAAAAGLAVVLSATYAALPKRRERYATDAARRHARPLPAEIQAQAPEAFEAWFEGKLDHRVAVPRLKDAQPAEGRLSHVQDRPAAYIRYRKVAADGKAGTIGVFVFDDSDHDVEAEPLPAFEVEKRLGYNVASWRDGEIVYQLVTDLDDRDIRALLEAQGSPPAGPPVPSLGGGPQVRPVSLDR